MNGLNVSSGQKSSYTLLVSAAISPSLPRCSLLPQLVALPPWVPLGSSDLGVTPFMAEELMSVLLPPAVYENVAVGMTGDARDAGSARGTGSSPMPSPSSHR